MSAISPRRRWRSTYAKRCRITFDSLQHLNLAFWLIYWSKKRIALDMIPVPMTKKQEKGFSVANHLYTEFTNAGTRIKYQVLT